MKETLKSLRIIVIAIVALLGVAYAQAEIPGWTEAPSNPPSNNTLAPINVSEVSQSKNGFVAFGKNTSPTATVDVAGNLFADQGVFGQTFTFAGGSPNTNKILASVDDTGNAVWKTASELGIGGMGGSGVSKIIAGNGISVSPVSGVGDVTVTNTGAGATGSVTGGAVVEKLNSTWRCSGNTSGNVGDAVNSWTYGVWGSASCNLTGGVSCASANTLKKISVFTGNISGNSYTVFSYLCVKN